ncbi:MAG TPA: thioredoxin domain-containing protein [Chloroflexota bacterium]|nr:thioredoxin domain-containing protein [Chloroflexota bacterium]
MANRLAAETSPYLLQHADNPVDWYPWGEEALARARAENKPILVSIGYSACHWCHVMERESFEDEATAALMNERFVCIKVDREERPDIDGIYMEAVQALTRHGGWPMTVFLLPDGTPFYGGTYFPPEPRFGMPSFRQVLEAISDAYRQRREEVEQGAAQLRTMLQQAPALRGRGETDRLTPTILERAVDSFSKSFDATNGGFGDKPKFPQPMNLEALLRIWRRTRQPQALQMVQVTLDKMAQGGIYDQLGGGFHRYSVDERWLVPHFEKMLYDNAQLSRVYLYGFQVTGSELYRRICTETLDYVRREMTSPEGGFYSTQDADSEGEEGKFFLWTPAEVTALLGETDGRLFSAYFDVTEEGNFEGRNILHTPRYPDVVAHLAGVSEARLREAIARGGQVLFEAREQRVKPGRDEKILTAWNGLMLRSFAEAAVVLERDDYLDVAVRNAEFVLQALRVPADAPGGAGGWRLRRTFKDGQAKLNAYLEDYAFYADGLLSLYEATLDLRWFEAARGLAQTMIEQFADGAGGGFFDTSADHEALLTRPKDLYDNATPSGNSVAAEVLLRLATFTGEARYRELAEGLLAGLAPAMAQHPSAFGRLLCALDFAVTPPKEIALVGAPGAADTSALHRVAFQSYLPNKVVALRPLGPDGERAAQLIPLLAEREALQGKATAYVCQHFTCQLPVTEPAALAQQLS